MSKHRAPRRLDRRAVTPVAALALSAAALTAVAPMASAQPRTHDRDSEAGAGAGSVGILNNLTLLPVQACGLQVPVLSGILDGPSGSCTQSDD
ncbi:MAG: hypothetical protein QOE59_1038 [Actinomycetota bacterium]|nr:hypothetical protein [Actinomycetota bacterium]